MNELIEQRMKLRIDFGREKDLLFSDNILQYAHWLENKLAKLQSENLQEIIVDLDNHVNLENEICKEVRQVGDRMKKALELMIDVFDMMDVFDNGEEYELKIATQALKDWNNLNK